MRKEVQSSHILAIDYSVFTKGLTVEFKNGSKYTYTGVPATTVASFLASPSKGQFFSQSIKNAFTVSQENE